MIGHALQWARLSEGAFDPAIGRVVELWDVTHRHAPPPDQGVRRLAGRQLYRAVELGLERGQHAVRFATDDVHLDLGGIAKGYGVDRAVDALRDHGIHNALVNAGGATSTRWDTAPAGRRGGWACGHPRIPTVSSQRSRHRTAPSRRRETMNSFSGIAAWSTTS